MKPPMNQMTHFEAYLVDDETRFLERHYPDVTPERPTPGVYSPPRDVLSITLPEAARILGITRAGAYKMAVERGELDSCRKVGPPDKPVYLVDVREVRQKARDRGQA